jgi:hypothetical protein
MYCGKAIVLAADAPKAIFNSAFPPGAPVCPNCGQMDATQKVSAIVSAGTSKGSAPTTQVGQLGGHVISGTVYRESISATLLARKLVPLNGEVLEKALAHLLPPEEKLHPLGVKVIRDATKEHNYQRLALAEFIKSNYSILWGKSYYCARCDVVFVPEQRTSAPLDQAQTFFFGGMLQEQDSDVCEIEAVRQAFFVYARGTEGYHIVDTAIWWLPGWGNRHPKMHSQPEIDCPKCRQAHEQLVSNLEAKGWEQTGERGKVWWQLRFSRKSSPV